MKVREDGLLLDRWEGRWHVCLVPLTCGRVRVTVGLNELTWEEGW